MALRRRCIAFLAAWRLAKRAGFTAWRLWLAFGVVHLVLGALDPLPGLLAVTAIALYGKLLPDLYADMRNRSIVCEPFTGRVVRLNAWMPEPRIVEGIVALLVGYALILSLHDFAQAITWRVLPDKATPFAADINLARTYIDVQLDAPLMEEVLWVLAGVSAALFILAWNVTFGVIVTTFLAFRVPVLGSLAARWYPRWGKYRPASSIDYGAVALSNGWHTKISDPSPEEPQPKGRRARILRWAAYVGLTAFTLAAFGYLLVVSIHDALKIW